jgi:hypothetical protein
MYYDLLSNIFPYVNQFRAVPSKTRSSIFEIILMLNWENTKSHKHKSRQLPFSSSASHSSVHSLPIDNLQHTQHIALHNPTQHTQIHTTHHILTCDPACPDCVR